MSNNKIKKGDEFRFDNLQELQDFSIANGNPKKGEYKVEAKKILVVTKL